MTHVWNETNTMLSTTTKTKLTVTIYLKNITITRASTRTIYIAGFLLTQKTKNIKCFSSGNSLRSEQIKHLESLAPKISSLLDDRREVYSNVSQLDVIYSKECSMFYVTDNILEIDHRLNSTIHDLTRGDHIMDHYYSILAYAKPLEYGNLGNITTSIRFPHLESEFCDEALAVERMFRAHESHFAALYGEVYHLLQQKDLLTEKAYSEISVIVKDLDKEYYIFKHILENYLVFSDQYFKLLDKQSYIQEIDFHFAHISRIFSERRSETDLDFFSIKSEINAAYLAELPFCIYPGLPENLVNYPYDIHADLYENDDPFALADRRIFYLNEYHGNYRGYDHNIHLEALDFHNNLRALHSLPYSDMEEVEISEEEDNLSAFDQLPFSHLEEDTFDLDDDMLNGFSQLPFNNEDYISTTIDTVLEVVDHILS